MMIMMLNFIIHDFVFWIIIFSLLVLYIFLHLFLKVKPGLDTPFLLPSAHFYQLHALTIFYSEYNLCL